MGLLDRVKHVAGEAADVAKKGASQVQSKVEQTQVRRRADEAAKQLGYLVAHERRGGAVATADADRLVTDITDAEAELERMRAAVPDVPPPAAPGQSAEEVAGE
jgi:Tfp pilus assembly protein PilV